MGRRRNGPSISIDQGVVLARTPHSAGFANLITFRVHVQLRPHSTSIHRPRRENHDGNGKHDYGDAEAGNGYQVTQAISVAVSLGLADRLADGGRSQ